MSIINRSFVIDRLLERLPWANGRTGVALAIGAFLFSLIIFWLVGGIQAYQAIGAVALRILFPPLVIVYILVVVQVLGRTRASVVDSLRPIVQLDDEAFSDVVERACRAQPRWELGAFLVGAVLFIALEGRLGSDSGYYWAALYYYGISLIMFATVGWSVYAVITITRLTNVLLRQPIEVDIFDQAPLEPIGLQSLSLSLAFIGAIILGIPSSPYPAASWQNFVIVSTLLLVSVLVFYLNMYGTHRLLTHLKGEQLSSAETSFVQAYRRLQIGTENAADAYRAASEVNAWISVKHELKQTQTWPYNTEMLRTLSVSVLTPVALGFARVIGPLLVGS
jgi:hypothetical protein